MLAMMPPRASSTPLGSPDEPEVKRSSASPGAGRRARRPPGQQVERTLRGGAGAVHHRRALRLLDRTAVTGARSVEGHHHAAGGETASATTTRGRACP